MSFIKQSLLLLGAFMAGYKVGSSDDSKIKEVIEKYVTKGKVFAHDIKSLIVSSLEEIDGLDISDYKLKLSKGFDYFKEKISDLIDIAEETKHNNDEHQEDEMKMIPIKKKVVKKKPVSKKPISKSKSKNSIKRVNKK